MSLPTSDDQDWSACVLLLETQAFIVVDMQLHVWGTGHTVFQVITQQTSHRRHHEATVITTQQSALAHMMTCETSMRYHTTQHSSHITEHAIKLHPI